MKKAIVSSLFLTCVLVFPLLIKTFGGSMPFIDELIKGLNPLFILLIILNFIGMICIQLISKFSTYIDTADLIEHNKEQEKIEKHIAYKTYKTFALTLLFSLLMWNRMYLTTIFACIWWLSNHFFKGFFDKFMQDIS